MIFQSSNFFLLIQDTYSVMQSNGNSFYGNVVSDSFHNASSDEDKILKQIYGSKYIRIVIMKILNFKSD